MAKKFYQTVEVLVSVVRNVHLHRAIYSGPRPDQNFWIILSRNCFDMAAIEWCKLFGSDHKVYQPVHWKNFVPDEEHDAFRASLLKALDIDQAAWSEYRAEIKRYRDTSAAHLDFRPPRIATYPSYELGLESAYFYYGWMLKIGDRRDLAQGYPRNIREYADRFAGHMKMMADISLAATSDILDDVR